MADPLVDVNDVITRLGLTLNSDQTIRLIALIADASAAVRSLAGQHISLETSTIRATMHCGRFTLPQHPVVSVGAVTNFDSTAVGGVGDAITYEWDGLSTIVGGGGLNRFDLDYGWGAVANITYTHGYDPVPDDIIAVVSQMAGRAFGLPSSDSGVTQESLGAYSVSYGIAAASGGVGMLMDERAIVLRYRRPRAPISML